jgi:hypothetical protein
MEDKMGDSFSDVQIHTGPQAAKACEDINAKAFTVGNNIAFNRGVYDPGSAAGQHVLAHELAHVRQQTGGAVSMLPQDDVEMEIDPDPKLEEEAEKTAQRVMEGGKLDIQRMEDTEVHVQRMHPSNTPISSGNGGAITDEVALREGLESTKEFVKGAANHFLKRSPGVGEAIAGYEAATSKDLETKLSEIDPPQSFIEKTAKRAAEMVQGADVQTNDDNSEGLT